MQIPVWLWGLVVIGGLGAYYWYSYGRHGGFQGYQKHQFQLREGEKVLQFFFGFYHVDSEKKDVALAVVGVKRVGKTFQIGITDQNRLILTENAVMGDGPSSFEKEEVAQAEIVGEVSGKMSGLTGQPEGLSTVKISLKDNRVVKIDTATSCAQAIVEWAKM